MTVERLRCSGSALVGGRQEPPVEGRAAGFAARGAQLAFERQSWVRRANASSERTPGPPTPPGSTIPRLGSVESSLVGLRGHSGWRRRRRLSDATGRQAAEVAAAAWAVVSYWHGVRERRRILWITGARWPACVVATDLVGTDLPLPTGRSWCMPRDEHMFWRGAAND